MTVTQASAAAESDPRVIEREARRFLRSKGVEDLYAPGMYYYDSTSKQWTRSSEDARRMYEGEPGAERLMRKELYIPSREFMRHILEAPSPESADRRWLLGESIWRTQRK
jgi:hypothetical protein